MSLFSSLLEILLLRTAFTLKKYEINKNMKTYFTYVTKPKYVNSDF